MKILLVEDEKDLANALCKGFELNGFSCDVANDGSVAVDKYYENKYEVIILDLNLPILDGLEVLKMIRSEDLSQKVIILSARSEVSDKVLGFELGANDYLAKPFDFLELLARVNSLSRMNIIQNGSILTLGDLRINTNAKKVFINEETVKLSSKEYRMLEYFILNRETVLSTEKLLETVWDGDIDLFTDTIKVHISNLRKKLSSSKNVVITTMRSEGYILEEVK